MKKIRIPDYNLTEELINSISHGVGAVFSIVGLILLLIKASDIGNLAIISVSIFGSAMLILYLISCIYHALSPNVKGKQVLRIIDHCNVFILVFSTIIPIALLGITDISGCLYLAMIGLVTIVGIVASIISIDKVQLLEVLCHLFNGWSILFFSRCLITNCGSGCLMFIILGGIMYSLGAVLYGIGSKKKYMHSIFHFLCLLGTLFHYLAIYLYIL